jgi:hypothetical protein
MANDIRMSRNVMFDGANWNLDDTTLTGAEIEMYQSGALTYGTFTAGANPRPYVPLWSSSLGAFAIAAAGAPLSIASAVNVVGLQMGVAGQNFGIRCGGNDNLSLVSADGGRWGSFSAGSVYIYGPITSHYSAGNSGFVLLDPSAPANAKRFALINTAQSFYLQSQNDDGSALANLLQITRANVLYCGSIVTSGSIQSTAPIYPGGGVTAGPQSSWYFGAHSSYGIYCNTGLYIESYVYCLAVESRAHVRAAGGLYDYARPNPIGVWTNFSPTISNGTLAGVYCCKWMVVGKSLFICFNIIVTSNGATNFGMALPGFTNAPEYSNDVFNYADGQTIGFGMSQASPNDVWVYMYKNILANAAFVGNISAVGTICIPIQ